MKRTRNSHEKEMKITRNAHETHTNGYRRKEQDSRPNRHLPPWLQEKGTGLSSQSTPTPMVTGERNRTLVPIDTYPHGYRRKEQDSRPNRHLPPWLQEKGTGLSSQSTPTPMVTGERNRTLVPIDTYPHGYRRKEQDSRPNRHLPPWLQEKGTGLSSQSTPTPMVTGERNRTLVPIDTYPLVLTGQATHTGNSIALGSFTSLQCKVQSGGWRDGAYGLTSLSEKT